MRLRYIIAFGLIYSLVYFFLALDVVGMEGRGPLIFLAPLRPFGLPWIMLLTALFLSRHLYSLRNVILWVLLMLSQYAISSYYLIPYLRFDSPEGEALMRIMNLRPEAVYYALAWYVFGQLIIWILFFMQLRKNVWV